MVKHYYMAKVKVLIQPPEDATWEDNEFIQAQFPDFVLNPLGQGCCCEGVVKRLLARESAKAMNYDCRHLGNIHISG
ncbi:hypothetical protein KY290_022834 [Solanum tuberosum]|uniref:Uncharacterized protein n=1 Tax=Solanum tuberosum TaxID=4113 RepID=A0ABQ7V5J4_SOLTU|nr:hypothetical protein KY284_021732 [Solanum tuberosum]KAH0759341.1 hypothetical protein KY290_022834 [Solanum tuberosum]